MDKEVTDVRAEAGIAFVDMLEQLRHGATVEDLGVHLKKLVKAVEETRKEGTLTFTLKIKPAGTEESGHLAVKDKVKITVPQHETKKTFMFAGKGGHLTGRDPRQMDISDLEDVKNSDNIRSINR